MNCLLYEVWLVNGHGYFIYKPSLPRRAIWARAGVTSYFVPASPALVWCTLCLSNPFTIKFGCMRTRIMFPFCSVFPRALVCLGGSTSVVCRRSVSPLVAFTQPCLVDRVPPVCFSNTHYLVWKGEFQVHGLQYSDAASDTISVWCAHK